MIVGGTKGYERILSAIYVAETDWRAQNPRAYDRWDYEGRAHLLLTLHTDNTAHFPDSVTKFTPKTDACKGYNAL